MSNVQTKYVNQKKDNPIKSKWWNEKPDQMYRHIDGVVSAMDNIQSYRQRRNIQYARLYSNSNFGSFYGSTVSKAQEKRLISSRMSLNVIKACVDTAMAKIAKNKPKPLFLTEKGNYSQQKRAKLLTQYVEGVFYDQKMYQKAQKMFKDGQVFGTGALKFFTRDDKINIERVMIDEIKVDDSDGMYGEPTSMYQTKYIQRETLIDMFPKERVKILGVTTEIDGQTSDSTASDMIKVTEAWHLPSSPDSGDGKHVISIENVTLHHEDYTRDYFPFVFFRWSDPIVGFYGTGIPEEIVGLQIEINKLLRSIQRSQNLMSHPKWFVENSSGVTASHLNNDDGGIIKYTINKPSAHVAQAMSPEVYNHLENLYRKAFEITGVTEMSATGKKPSGLDSAVAIREYNDVETERFIIVGQMYEAIFLDSSKIIVDMSRDLYDRNKNLSTNFKGKKFVQKIRWEDVDMDEDKYVMTLFPVSQLPSTPSGRLQFVKELTVDGFIDKEFGLDLLDFPDLEAYIDNKTASIEILKEIIEKMIVDGEYTPPEPFMNLMYNIKYTQGAYLQAKLDNVEEDKLKLLIKFMQQNKTLLDKAAETQEQPLAQQQGMVTPTDNPMEEPQGQPQTITQGAQNE